MNKRDQAVCMLDWLRDGISDVKILEEIIYNWMSSDKAIECLDDIARLHEIPIAKIPKTNIKINGHIGTWYVIGGKEYKCKKVYLLEHETYGEDAAHIIVDENLNIVLEDVYNGFADLEELEESEEE
jgi:hypothetical protein